MKKITATAAKALDTTINTWWGKKALAEMGEVGIEIECEGENLARAAPPYWNVVADGSLRGESCEYVLKNPIKRESVEEALKSLAATLHANGSIVKDSYRTSVHVHINQTDLKFRQIFSEICMYLIVEELLTDFCGKERIGNLFCLRARDAEHLIDTLRESVRSGNYNYFADLNAFKYGAVNIAALGQYGSLEFRAFRGTTNPELIQAWVQVLLDIKDAAKKVENPQVLINDFSRLTPEKFIETYFAPSSQRIIFEQKDVKQRLYEGVRYAQEIAFAIPSWDPYKAPEKKNENNIDLDYGVAPAPMKVKKVGVNLFADQEAPAWAQHNLDEEFNRIRARAEMNPLLRPNVRRGAQVQDVPVPPLEPFFDDDDFRHDDDDDQ